MNCDETGVLLHPYVDGELDLVHSIEIEKHLKTCPACAQALENHEALRAAMQDGSFYYRTPPLRRLLPPSGSTHPTYALLALAASALIAVFLTGRLMPRNSDVQQAILDSHLRSLLPGHLEDVQSTDQHTVKPWFNGKLDFSPPVADFAQQGFPLTGGRVDSVAGREVAALIYRRGQHVINVYVWLSPGSRDTTVDQSARQGYNILHWTRSSFEWWIISDLNATELGAFSELLRGAAP
jgi:anti-sigma factor RsiW